MGIRPSGRDPTRRQPAFGRSNPHTRLPMGTFLAHDEVRPSLGSPVAARMALACGLPRRRGMNETGDFLNLAGVGSALAIALRWLFRLDVEIHWTVGAGAASLAMQPWLQQNVWGHTVGQSGPMLEFAIGTTLLLAMLGILQLARNV